LLKRSAKPASNPDAFLRVLATTNLAVGRSLHVVALGEKAWLVGSTDASIGLIAEVEDKELVDALALRAAAEPEAPRRDFTSLLGELLGRKGGKRSGSRNQPSPLPGDFFSRQKDRLKKF
jgi:flagellar protein FliO/FliZ